MRLLTIIALVVIHLSCLAAIQNKNEDPMAALSRLLHGALDKKNGKLSFLDTLDLLLLDVLPVLFNQKPCNVDGKFEQNRKHFLEDTSNDEIKHASVVEIIKRSGFLVKTHKVMADDGYITILYHLINPLADRSKLKQPPLMVMHGGIIDPVAYLWASAIQHHPEKYPRTIEDGPITSWNRSLAFTLSNNGYDVWLVGTRGSNIDNQGLNKLKGKATVFKNADSPKNMTLAESLNRLRPQGFWHYNFDDIIHHEAPRQLEKILELTGAKNLTLFGFSFSSVITLPLLASRPDISKHKIHNYINMAPLINWQSTNTWLQIFAKLGPLIPVELGTLLFTRVLTSQLFRQTVTTIAESKEVRYLLIKAAISLLLGSSGKYRTFLELPALGHVFQPTSFQQVVHGLQMFDAKKHQKYDYGAKMNKLVYNDAKPPIYDVSQIHVKNWMLISAENDNLSPASSVKQILRQVNPKPKKHVRVPGFSHYDLVTGADNDIQVNLPILEFLDRHTLHQK